ncbi:MAG TPA: pitrilysin family protein [Vicinamibacterales bacterium]|nr:pitrilysin family protein [Vicinamibacterales bacterium]
MRATSLSLALACGVFGLATGDWGLATAAQPPMQQTSPTQGVVKKGKVPISKEILKINLPKPSEADLPNGVHMLVLEDHRLPQVSFQLYVSGAGGYFEPADHPGLAGFTAALMREGTATRTSEQISRQLEVMAATLNVGASAAGSEASITGSCLSDQIDTVMDMAADVLQHPAFADEEVARYKQRTRAQLMQQRANPGFLANEMFAKAIYGDHPASRTAPSLASLDALTRDALVEFHRARYVPDHAVFAIAGDITMADARKLVDAHFAGWKKSGAAKPQLADPAAISGSKIYFIGRPNSVQTNLVVGTQSISAGDPDNDVLEVMNKVIGGGPTGRLFIHLREEKGYTYGAGSSMTAPFYRGQWSASTSVRTEVTDPALHDLIAEITTLRDQPVPAAELADAKRSMIASFALSLESPAQMLNLYVNSWRFNFPRDYWDKYPERISSVTAAQVQAAARKYLAADRLRIVAVGDPARVADALKKMGEVETYDAEGKKVSN